MSSLFTFPEAWQFELGTAMDDAIKAFSRNHREALNAFKSGIIWVIQFINDILAYIPWFVLILLVAFLGWKVSKKWYIGVVYGGMLLFVGCCGLWAEMLETISIVTAAVTLSLLLGFPLGILLAMSQRANKIILPILDLMQTLPSFVYLVPAVILFSPGKTPALLATTIYSIVPMIRMTSHGLRHVDHEVIEAAYSFGSTRGQTLAKVQIPQALPTIMTGVNQTIMMAMSMVVTCALIGAEGLGMEILVATNRVEMAEALLPGICIVIVAIILDRLTQGLVKKSEVER